MFMQVIRGKVKDAGAAKSALESWEKEIRPGAKGFLGSTGGVTDDGTFITIARFESEDAAKANSERPEQGAWWEQTKSMFDGNPVFYDCPTVDVFGGGGSDDAGFVQLMVYRATDVEGMREFFKQMDWDEMAKMRPDIMGGVTGITTDGTVIDINYFTSEAEAREGEKKEMPAEMQEMASKMGEYIDPDNTTYIDLRDPWLR